MQVEALLPRVAAEHAPFKGFQAGDVINDHDVALFYVRALPCITVDYRGLPCITVHYRA